MFRDLKVALFLAAKTIVRGRAAATALTIFVMSLAFINLVFISSILKGALGAIDRQIRVNYVSDVVVEHQENPVRKDYVLRPQQLRDEIARLPHVVDTTQHYKLAGVMSYDKDRNGEFVSVPAQIIGVDPDHDKSFSQISGSMVAGKYLTNDTRSDDIILGLDLAGGPGAWSTIDNLGGVAIGRKVTVAFSNGTSQQFTVRGIFQTKFPFTDLTAFITSKEAESILGVQGQASQVLVKLDDTSHTAATVAAIKKLAPNLVIRPWTDYLGVFGDVSKTFDIIIGIISAIGLAVASFVIFILIFIAVTSKRRQIGVLKAIGIRRRIIVWSYITQALFFAVAGVAIGTAIIRFAMVPYFAAHPLILPIGAVGLVLNPTRFAVDALLLVAAAIVAGLVPSWQVASERIMDAIWGG